MYRAADSQLSVYDFLPPYHGELAATGDVTLAMR